MTKNIILGLVGAWSLIWCAIAVYSGGSVVAFGKTLLSWRGMGRRP